MNPSKHTMIRSAIWIAIAMFAIAVFHIGDSNFVLHVGQFSPLLGAAIGGFLALFSLFSSRRRIEDTEPWVVNEQLAWILIGLGIIMWGLGESFWQYYTSIGQSPLRQVARAESINIHSEQYEPGIAFLVKVFWACPI